jgi:hypothetical protein
MLSLPRERAAAGVLGYRAGRRERICPGCCAHSTQGKAPPEGGAKSGCSDMKIWKRGSGGMLAQEKPRPTGESAEAK